MADVTRTIEIEVITQDAQKNVDELNKSLDENQKETEETTEETKKYDKQLEETSKTTSGMTAKLDKMTGGMLTSIKGMAGMVKGLKSIRIALAATGIGAIILLITSLVQSFKRTEAGQDRWNKIIRVTSAILDNFLDILGSVGEGIIEALVNPLETVTKLWEGLKDFFSDPLGSIKAGYEAVKNAISDVVDEVDRDIKSATKLADLEAKTNRLEREFWVDSAKAQRDVADLRLKARQEDQFTAAERAEFQQQALDQLDAVAKKEEEVARGRLAIVLQSNALANSNREALDEAARLEANLIDVQTRRLNQSIRLTSQLNTLRRQANAELKAEAAEITGLQELERKGVESQITLEEIKLDIKKENTEIAKTETDTQIELNDALSVTASTAQGVMDILSGKTTAKDVFNFLLTTLGSILRLTTGGAAGGIFGVIGGLFADGGYTGKGGKYEPAGIVHKGEYVVPQNVLKSSFGSDLVNQLESMRTGLKGYADGGFVTGLTAQEAQIAQLNQSLSEQRIVLPIEDLRTVNTRVTVVEDRATL